MAALVLNDKRMLKGFQKPYIVAEVNSSHGGKVETAKEMAPHGVRVNAVAPGLVSTEIGAYRTQAELDKVLARTPAGRMGNPEEIAEAVAFLASGRASYITGEILSADGGRL